MRDASPDLTPDAVREAIVDEIDKVGLGISLHIAGGHFWFGPIRVIARAGKAWV